MLRCLISYPKFFFRFIRPVHAIPKRINGNISKKLHTIWKILFILGSYEFLVCLECISRNGLSFGHSDWDIISVSAIGCKQCSAAVDSEDCRILQSTVESVYTVLGLHCTCLKAFCCCLWVGLTVEVYRHWGLQGRKYANTPSEIFSSCCLRAS